MFSINDILQQILSTIWIQNNTQCISLIECVQKNVHSLKYLWEKETKRDVLTHCGWTNPAVEMYDNTTMSCQGPLDETLNEKNVYTIKQFFTLYNRSLFLKTALYVSTLRTLMLNFHDNFLSLLITKISISLETFCTTHC